MLRPRQLPPPTTFTLGDKMRLVMGALMLLLGIALLWRMLPLGLTVPAILVCAAFIGFGVYRLRLGYIRWQEYARQRQTKGD